jgi:hypothetical protein
MTDTVESLSMENRNLRHENKSLIDIIDALKRRLSGDDVPSFESPLSFNQLQEVFVTSSYADSSGNQLAVVISNTIRVKNVSVIVWMKDAETPVSIELSSQQAKTLARTLFGFSDVIDST